MHGIVSLLDANHNQLVEQLWLELEHRFHIRDAFATRIPHFTYHVADDYDFARVEHALISRVKETTTFTIKASGIGIFSSPKPIIYIPLVCTAALTNLHQSLWVELNGLCNGRHNYYAPDSWIPHITLSHDNITPENLGPIVKWLNQQDLNWEININNFTILRDPDDNAHNLLQRFDFSN